MSAAPAPTILDLKLAFLRSQIQALSAPLRIPVNYQPPDENQAIRQRAIDDALFQLNARIQEHAKLVYSAPAQRHVAEQVDALYWMAGERDVSGELARGQLELGTDFAADVNITSLPDAWEDEEEVAKRPEEAQRYVELAAHIKGLNDRRTELREKVARYKALKGMLEPFENSKEDVQGNLCTRDGEVEAELQKMGMLMARVKGRLEGLETSQNQGDEEMDLDFLDEEKKADLLLNDILR
ncbi:hypothetical protein VE04_00496 [Pseudogymnoascus sp. 24MN13]|nr:hypothetical protein VE04_00496 [Pseudogymnoascus sp. 24MN13]